MKKKIQPMRVNDFLNYCIVHGFRVVDLRKDPRESGVWFKILGYNYETSGYWHPVDMEYNGWNSMGDYYNKIHSIVCGLFWRPAQQVFDDKLYVNRDYTEDIWKNVYGMLLIGDKDRCPICGENKQ